MSDALTFTGISRTIQIERPNRLTACLLPVQSRHLVDWIEPEPLRLDCPSFGDELVWREAFEHLQPAAEVVGGDEVVEVPSELVMAIVVIALHSGFLDGSVHPLDLPVGPWVVGFGQPMLDAMAAAGSIEGVSTEHGGWA